MAEYTFTYSHERYQDGLKESAVEVAEDGEVVARFAVIGYADEAERKEMAVARLSGLLPVIAAAKADEAVHPPMKKSEVVSETQLPETDAKAMEIV